MLWGVVIGFRAAMKATSNEATEQARVEARGGCQRYCDSTAPRFRTTILELALESGENGWFRA